MPRMFFALGLVSALAAAAAAMGFLGAGGGGKNVYAMRIEGSHASGYTLREGDKQSYHLPPKGEVQWDFTNNTDPKEDVRFRMGDVDFKEKDCPVHWSKCEYEARLPVDKPHSVSAKPRKGPSKHYFNIYVWRDPGGPIQKIDPELQIDSNLFPTLFTWIAALIGAVLFFASWWTRRRASPRPQSGNARP